MTARGRTRETARIWDENGALRASVQSGRFPAINATGILKDGDVDGDTMNMFQMLEFSQTIKRGSGKKAD